MPFKSKAQAREMFANQPSIAKRWAKETPSIKKLPEHVKPKKEQKSGIHVLRKKKSLKG